MDLFFGDDAERFRQLHLTDRILFLPYGSAVDHFQHLVYSEPNATPDERAAMWQEMERIYLPSFNWGDLEHPASGRRWQAQLHIYKLPFYYIDYSLALTCALQLWVLATEDRDAAMARYVALCRRGGEAPFGQLVKSAGLTSPFAPGCLQAAVENARHRLITREH
jgi:oligoendopeptidase F